MKCWQGCKAVTTILEVSWKIRLSWEIVWHYYVKMNMHISYNQNLNFRFIPERNFCPCSPEDTCKKVLAAFFHDSKNYGNNPNASPLTQINCGAHIQ